MADKREWRKRARKWRKLYRAQTYLLGVEQEYSADGRETLHKAVGRARRWKQIAKTWGQQWYDLSIKMTAERDAALNKAEELRHELLRAETELARVQTVGDADEAQRHNLLAWRRRVRGVMPGADHVYTIVPSTTGGSRENCICFRMNDWDALRRAIEAEAESKEET